MHNDILHLFVLDHFNVKIFIVVLSDLRIVAYIYWFCTNGHDKLSDLILLRKLLLLLNQQDNLALNILLSLDK